MKSRDYLKEFYHDLAYAPSSPPQPKDLIANLNVEPQYLGPGPWLEVLRELTSLPTLKDY